NVHIEPAYQDARRFMQRSRCLVLCSLVEGRNRAIREAMSCDIPVVMFQHFNQYTRSAHEPALPKGGGVLAPQFTANALAGALAEALDPRSTFSPRDAVLQTTGKRVVLDRLIEAFPYYAENLPNYAPGRHLYNPWVDVAMRKIYACSL